jgi:hypothetical protein
MHSPPIASNTMEHAAVPQTSGRCFSGAAYSSRRPERSGVGRAGTGGGTVRTMVDRDRWGMLIHCRLRDSSAFAGTVISNPASLDH